MTNSLETFFNVVFFVAGIVTSVYVWGMCCRLWSSTFGRKLWVIGNHLCSEVRPLALFAIPIDTFHELMSYDPFWDTLTLVFNSIWFYLCLKDNKDDRWKRRKKKSLEKVKQLGGKLVVVPVPVGSGA